ncbi:hypothetical protein PFAG_01756 [Plasmodium falciparum Santa Lucia]|uniref:Uncharacterized protein n=16 Tax=Plasmodium falciparum TaxID=5833 RepID=Q8IBN3_PLAF7|nr:conserved Plasmodium protein, unknown function [Plasmodium falciparum 3D7]ETW19226.1 hypothetical protein PFFVO_01799 [Plasmodium falciparum Vietnam Oak-Knoll (FVO)]ETW31443.1 hypothetical protein PFFCH_01125 [Plasmodium falciparum FCH/4]ETW37404.1 hypothetical protein PFTANZ_01889 [Plasmodium falciparum Tanzania (2000708)]ETW43809.1 hypothetical protein PFNF135_01931 [Plasmodium falciparum NF135/5.C10]ETW50145.1 hypothetical protein PFMALIP_01833 [Plasmodium falciparum MaliPS096_E11]ETW57|eukprot:XP_001349120.1 conserved Plasmodium protein, unknown function [Plasmodium falciparum 3D7]
MQKNMQDNSNKNEFSDMKDNKNDGKVNENSGENMYIFDEPDDELEEFEEMGSVALNVDTDLENWEEDWGAAGWDDDDDDDDKFILKVESELQKFKANMEAEKDLNK